MKTARIYSSSESSGRMLRLPDMELAPIDSEEYQLMVIYPGIRRQIVRGFGGALTPASADVYARMSRDKRDELMGLLFSDEGLKYTVGRVSIAACDFSDGLYSYCDKEDETLESFSIARDEEKVLTFLRDAVSNCPSLRILASPWSPPAWMKDNGDMLNGGKLRKENYGVYADYLIKFIQAYRIAGIPITWLTIQNEPDARQIWESCNFIAEDEAGFIAEHLAPKLRAAGISAGLWIWDHNKDKIFTRARDVLKNQKAAEAVEAIAFHWYTGTHFENLALCREFFPDKFLAFTEGCVEMNPMAVSAMADSSSSDESLWRAGELYGRDLAGNLNSGMSVYMDWNVLLDETGGPNHVQNFCSSPLIYDTDKGEIKPQPAYWHIAHFSRFITTGSQIVAISRFTEELPFTAAVTPEGETVAVVINPTGGKREVLIRDMSGAGQLKLELPPHSITTCVC